MAEAPQEYSMDIVGFCECYKRPEEEGGLSGAWMLWASLAFAKGYQ